MKLRIAREEIGYNSKVKVKMMKRNNQEKYSKIKTR